MISLFRSYFQKPSIPDEKGKPSVEPARSADGDLNAVKDQLNRLYHELVAVVPILLGHLQDHHLVGEPELHSFLHRLYTTTRDTADAMRVTRERAGIRSNKPQPERIDQ